MGELSGAGVADTGGHALHRRGGHALTSVQKLSDWRDAALLRAFKEGLRLETQALERWVHMSSKTACSVENSSAMNFLRSTMSFTVVWLEPRKVIMPSMKSAKVRGTPSSKSRCP